MKKTRCFLLLFGIGILFSVAYFVCYVVAAALPQEAGELAVHQRRGAIPRDIRTHGVCHLPCLLSLEPEIPAYRFQRVRALSLFV